MNSSFRVPPVPSTGEVDLLAFFQVVRRQKKTVLIISSGVALLAVAYALLATPEYQVSSVLGPAAINELDALNRLEVYKLPPNEALVKVGASLESYETRLSFFRTNQQLLSAFERSETYSRAVF